ncbi:MULTISPECIES: carboxylesterase/lipase family protein [Maribacter]|uniref:Carboxylic ester hydrolase n=1 Tax=Maribacter flavus TaxID=1658664 RepID=A0ABU7IKB5_9FLAO|nr:MULTISPECIES: carboxylesterase family protein [Maribacter]MDC6406280.1 carboxylesterase family protein [Maribacter sp. PR66]MEE1973400.1 carboxylesterase family protein [Maribacter flavus]
MKLKTFGVLLVLLTYGVQAQTIQTKDGMVKGYTSNDIQIFKGIPFAQPPVGDLRWKSPQPVTPWEGVKECTEFGPSPIQNKPEPFLCWTEEFIAKSEPLSEDCLYLNVWTPAKSENEKLPVFVWIYGGGLSSGSANCDIYDGTQIAEQGVVYVSINYRVGVLGFMAHPELSAESGNNASGNYGFMDQLQALKWVKNNIEVFGGDPNNVTIAGQSAGSFSVNAQIASPLASGYFHKAITQSGGILSGRLMQDLVSAEQQGLAFQKLAGASSLSDLRKIPAEELQKISSQREAGRFGVVLDDYFLPTDLLQSFKDGKQNQVSVLSGWLPGDAALFPVNDITSDSFKEQVFKNYGDRTGEFLEYFPANTNEEAAESQKKLNLLNFAGIPSYLLAKYMDKDVWLYEFTHVPTDKPGFPNYGAFHTSEVPFALHTLDQWQRDWKPAERTLENQMSGYWVNFAKTGNPNGENLPNWEPYDLNTGNIMVFDTGDLGMQNRYKDEFEFLTRIMQ